MTQSYATSDLATSSANPSREGIVRVTLVGPGEHPYTLSVRGPVRVELDADHAVTVHCDRQGGLWTDGAREYDVSAREVKNDAQVIQSRLDLARAIHKAARGYTVAEREKMIRELVEGK
jgi:hypothetical protein